MGTFVTKQPSKDASQRKPATGKSAPVRQGRNFSSLSAGAVLLQQKPACACGGGCPRCQAEPDLEGTLPIQIKLNSGQPVDEKFIAQTGFSGHPGRFPHAGEINEALGGDFSQVEVYKGAAAKAANMAFGSLGYTYHGKVALKDGDIGTQLHEAVHLVQLGYYTAYDNQCLSRLKLFSRLDF